MSAALDVDVRDDLDRLSQPRLYLQAARDRLVPPSCAARIRALKPSAEFVTVDGPHLLLEANPVESWRHIEGFLERVWRRDAGQPAPVSDVVPGTPRSGRPSPARGGWFPGTPRAGAQRMCWFYGDVRSDDVDLQHQGGMLLFQWGTYDCAKGEHFEVDITRQLIPGGGDDEDIWQLHLTYYFRPSDALSALGRGDRWCKTPCDLAPFEVFLAEHPVIEALGSRDDGQVNLGYKRAGQQRHEAVQHAANMPVAFGSPATPDEILTGTRGATILAFARRVEVMRSF